MKNQYFGDVNDYKKYGLLRILTGHGELSTAVCWMLTPDDSRSDGRFTGYLSQPTKWRSYDPLLYDHLRNAVVIQKRRDVQYAADVKLVPGARYDDRLLPDDAEGREAYWRSFSHVAEGCTLVFFDPDNGLEVKSKPYGRKDSSKYLYWHELSQTLDRGYSALIYQHFRREKRDRFIARMAQEMHRRTQQRVVYSFRTNRVVFFLLPLDDHLPSFERYVAHVEHIWARQIEVIKHELAQQFT
jgi:hypothetical protein